jgi:Na+-driven multidrug efflux pump
MLAGLIMLFGYTASAALFHSWGDTRRPLVIMAGANVLNVLLDPVFIFGLGPIPALGLRGAGLASFLGNALAFVSALALLSRNHMVREGRRHYAPDDVRAAGTGSAHVPRALPVNRALISNITRLAIPASAQAVMRPASGMVLLWIVSFYGTAALAAFGIGLKLTMFSGVFMTGLTAAVASIVGRELGAERVPEARGTVGLALSRGLAVFVPVGVFYFAAATLLMRIFSTDPAVIAMGARYIRILAPSLVFLAIMATFSGTFQGAGDTLSLMQTSLIANAPFKLGVAAILGLVWPAALWGVWLAIALSIVVEAGLLSAWYKSDRWYRHGSIDWRES